MDCIGYLKIEPIEKTQIKVSINQKPGKHKANKKSLPGNHTLIPLQPLQVLTIGRSFTKNIHLNNPTVSMNHGVIWSTQFDEDSAPVVYLHDQSRNAIQHNGNKLGRGKIAILNDDDVIEIQMAAKITFKAIADHASSINEVDQLLEDWEITNKLIGSGSFGSVFLARKTNSSQLFAVKIIQKNYSSYFSGGYLTSHESELLARIKHVRNCLTTSTHLDKFQWLLTFISSPI